MKRIKGRKFPPWMNGNIMHELRKKDSVRKKLKSSPTDSLHNRFKQLRANVKKLIRESRSKFFSSLNATFQTNPKRFWSIFKLKNKQSSVPNIMSMANGTESKSNRNKVSTSITIANLLTPTSLHCLMTIIQKKSLHLHV